jgi:uncharacterized membrane protein
MDNVPPPPSPLITNDAVVLGLLMSILGFVFWSASSDKPFWKRFYAVVPSVLLCYFVPSIFATAGLVSGDLSKLYYVASQYLLPASLVLMTLAIDFKGLLSLGPKLLILFLVGCGAVMLGGPAVLWLGSLFDPSLVASQGNDAIWRGMATVAGSWIGGGANQAAMKEVFEVDNNIFSVMVAVDVVIASLWMAVLLWLAGRAQQIDAKTGADVSAIEALRDKITAFQQRTNRMPTTSDTMQVLAVGFGFTGLSHLLADWIVPWVEKNAPQLADFSLTSKFFWVVVLATTFGLLLGATPARELEGAGASRIGQILLYVLIASVGLKMNLLAVFDYPELFLLGAIWIAIHAAAMLLVAKLLKAPFFYMAVGSQAAIGGAASAPIVASAFHPSLAPVGVLLAVFGYAIGTYCGWLTGLMMRAVAGG